MNIGDRVRIDRIGWLKHGSEGVIVGVASDPIVDEGEYLVDVEGKVWSIHFTDLIELEV